MNDNRENKEFGDHQEHNEFNYFLKDNERLSKQLVQKKARKNNRFFLLGNVLLIVLIYFIIFKPAMEKSGNQANSFSVSYDLIDFEIKLFADKQNIICDVYITNNTDQTVQINEETIFVEVFNVKNKTKAVFEAIEKLDIHGKEHKHVLFYIDTESDSFYMTLYYKGKDIFQTPVIFKEKLLYE